MTIFPPAFSITLEQTTSTPTPELSRKSTLLKSSTSFREPPSICFLMKRSTSATRIAGVLTRPAKSTTRTSGSTCRDVNSFLPSILIPPLQRPSLAGLDEVAGDAPMPVRFQGQRDGFNGRLLVLEVGVILHDHVLARRTIGRVLQVFRTLELARHGLAQRLAHLLQCADPLVLGHGFLEGLRRLIPTLTVLAGVDDREPRLRRLLGDHFRLVFAGCCNRSG